MSRKPREMSMTAKVLMGLVLGVIVGVLVYQLPDGDLKNNLLIDGVFQLLGQVFLRSIMMLVVPLVFVSLVNGVSSMGDIGKVGRIGVKTVSFYLVTTAFAIILSLALGSFLKPGIGVNLEAIKVIEPTIGEKMPLVNVLFEMVPSNPIQAMAEGNMLQIIIFAILVGVGISTLGEKGHFLSELFLNLNDLMMKLVEIVMSIAPFGVFGLIARTMSTSGIDLIIPLAKFVGSVYLGLIIQMVVVYGLLLKVFTNFSITKFYKKYLPAMSIAFSTASSAATVPISMDILENEMGVSKDISAFTIPLGATINMDGTAIMQGVSAFFVAQIYGIEMTFPMMLTIVLTATLASIGTAGVPGAGTIMLSMVLQSVGLPLEGVGLIMGIDRIVDMGRTTTNITGDAVCTAIIAHQEDAIEESIAQRVSG